MGNSSNILFRVVVVLFALTTVRGEARADFPTGLINATREGSRVRLEIDWFYRGSMVSYCDGVLYRQRAGGDESSDGKRAIFDGDLGHISKVCKCSMCYGWEEGMEDATGKECDPGVRGSCPDGNCCYCSENCRELQTCL